MIDCCVHRTLIHLPAGSGQHTVLIHFAHPHMLLHSLWTLWTFRTFAHLSSLHTCSLMELSLRKTKVCKTKPAVDLKPAKKMKRNKTEESEVSEDVTEVKKKKKKTKKEKSAHADTTESLADLENEDLNKKTNKNKQPVIPEKDEINEEEGIEDEDEEELSPEERRVLERKLKKILKKEAKKKQKEKKSEKEEKKSSIAQTQALEYLTCWSEKRDEWKFQKTRQVWLLQQMYDSEKVPDAHFSILLSYLEGLRGVARDLTVQKAEALVRFGAGPGGEEEGGTTEAQKKTQRAREVIQILS